MHAANKLTLRVVMAFAAALSGVLCGISAYHQFGDHLIAALFFTAALTAQLLLQQIALMSKRGWQAAVAGLVAFVIILTPIDIAGVAASQTLIAAANDASETAADDAGRIARVVGQVKSKADRLAATEAVWRKRAADEAEGRGLSGNGGGYGAVYSATLSVADEAKAASDILNRFVTLGETNSSIASQRIAELRMMVADRRQKLADPATETAFRKRRIAIDRALNDVIEASKIDALSDTIIALETPLSGPPSADAKQRARERDALAAIEIQAAVLASSIRDIQTLLETEMPSGIDQYSPPGPFARILMYPESAIGWLAVAAALHLGIVLAILLHVRSRDDEAESPAPAEPLPADAKPALRAV